MTSPPPPPLAVFYKIKPMSSLSGRKVLVGGYADESLNQSVHHQRPHLAVFYKVKVMGSRVGYQVLVGGNADEDVQGRLLLLLLPPLLLHLLRLSPHPSHQPPHMAIY